MILLRRAALVIGVLFVAEVLLGGCAYSIYHTEVRGLIIDSAGQPVCGAELFVVVEGMGTDDGILERVRTLDEEEADTPPEYRERLFATTDPQGRFTLTLDLGIGRSIGPIATVLRALFGPAKPSFSPYVIVVKADGFRRRAYRIDGGKWLPITRKPGDPWVYEMPKVRLEAK